MRSNAYKITLLGESTVGKTSLTTRIRDDKFNHHTGSTIGAAYSKIKLNDIHIEIWDTAGQEKYMSLISTYYRDSNVVLLIYDMIRLETVNRLHTYISKIRDETSDECKMIIIGTKSDLLLSDNEAKRIVDRVKKEFDKYSHIFDIHYTYVSSKTGHNIPQLLDTVYDLCRQIVLKDKHTDTVDLNSQNKTGLTNFLPNCCS